MKKKLLAMLMVGMLSTLLLAGCGGSSEKKTDNASTTKTETTSKEKESKEDSSEDEEETSAQTENAQEETSDTENEVTETDTSIYEQYLNSCYIGVSDQDETSGIYLCFNNDADGGMIVLYDGKENKYLCVAGSVQEEEQSDGSSGITITDAQNGSTFSFTAMYDEDNDVYSLDLGEQFGTATVGASEPSDVLEVLQQIDANGATSVLD